jgi:hypothetical protein
MASNGQISQSRFGGKSFITDTFHRRIRNKDNTSHTVIMDEETSHSLSGTASERNWQPGEL